MEIPVNIPFAREDLNEKMIRFRVRSAQGDPPHLGIADGRGELIIDFSYEKEGMFVATIYVRTSPDGLTGVHQMQTIPLDQKSVDCIRILPESIEGATLECLDPFLPC